MAFLLTGVGRGRVAIDVSFITRTDSLQVSIPSPMTFEACVCVSVRRSWAGTLERSCGRKNQDGLAGRGNLLNNHQ